MQWEPWAGGEQLGGLCLEGMVWLQVGKNPKIETKRKITYNAVLGEERFKCWGTLPNSDVQLLSFHKRCCAFDWQQNLAWLFFSIAVVLRMPQALLAELWLSTAAGRAFSWVCASGCVGIQPGSSLSTEYLKTACLGS